MSKWYSREERRRYRKERQDQAKLVADRLLGKKKPKEFFGGTEMQNPFQYGSIAATSLERMRKEIELGENNKYEQAIPASMEEEVSGETRSHRRG